MKNIFLQATGYKLKTNQGFSLLEILIAGCIFLIFAGGIYFGYANLLDLVGRTRIRTLGISVLNKEVEIIRDLQYDKVGIIGGFPPGVVQAQKTVVYEGQSFVVDAYIRNIDNPFDGTTGGSPNDTAPADHRLVHLQVSCPTCPHFTPVSFTTWVSPQNLESSTQNGSLFVNVFDADGKAISGANVRVVNNAVSPTITINDTTNNSGTLQLVDIPTSTDAYQITITKTGYSSSVTYTPGAVGNPNPIQPHATVASQLVTVMSFGIDRLSSLAVHSRDYLCQATPNFDFSFSGTKLIGQGPDIFKYSSDQTTDSSGDLTINNLEWDTYKLIPTDVQFSLAGSSYLLPLTINPNLSINLSLLAEPASSTGLLISAADTNGAPISGVSIQLSKSGFSESKLGGEKFLNDTNWSGSNYTSQDGNLDDNNPAGEIKLIQVGGAYPTSTNSYLISNTFDLGTSSTTFRSLDWLPASQPNNTTLKFQLASNNDNSSWSFIGPDGTASTYYYASSSIGTSHNGSRYLRYKGFFDTTDQNNTPLLQNLEVGFSSSCIPDAQAFWNGLPTGTYNIVASKSGYQNATSSVTVVGGWQEAKVMMSP